MTLSILNQIERLENEPSPSEIDEILEYVLVHRKDSTRSESFKLVIDLLGFTIPETYKALDSQIRTKIHLVLSSSVGLGNLLTRIELLTSQNKNPTSVEYQTAVRLLEVLNELLKPGLVLRLIKETEFKFNGLKEIEKLLFKGRAFSITVSSFPSTEDVGLMLEDPNRYVGYLNSEISSLVDSHVDLNIIRSFYLALLSFNPNASMQLLDSSFASAGFPTLLKIYRTMREIEKKDFISKYLLPFITQRFLNRPLEESKMYALVYLLKRFGVDILINDSLLNKILDLNNIQLHAVIGLALASNKRSTQNILKKLLAIWSDPLTIKTSSIISQENQTCLLLHLTNNLDEATLQGLLKEKVFLDGVSNRIGSFSNNIKSLGIIYADKVCELAKEKKIFDLEGITNENLTSMKYYDLVNLSPLTEQKCWDILDAPEIVEVEGSDIQNYPTNYSSAPLQLEKLNIDSDDESESDDDPTVGRHVKPASPVYIKDILLYLNTDAKDPQCYDRRRVALVQAPSLIRQKAKFGKEVSFYAEQLATNFIGLTNQYEDTGFESLRLNCLISVVVAYPDVTTHLIRIFAGGDYSLSQRICILSSISLAARELKGFQDNVVIQSYENRAFPTKLLPQQLHNQFVSPEDSKLLITNNNLEKPFETNTIDYGLTAVTTSLQDELLHETTENAKDILAGGKILRISKKLTNQKNKKPVMPGSLFHKIAGPKFFFPLAALYHQVGQFQIGHYSSILTGHFIKTLSLIIHAAYPTSIDLQDMIKELFIIITPIMTRTKLDELQVIESIITSYLLILDILDGEFLVQNYKTEVILIKNWLEDNWEAIIDERIKGLAAGLLLQVSKLTETYERILIDQFYNGLY